MREFPNATRGPWAVHLCDETLIMDAKGEKIASTFRFSGEGSPKTIRAMKDDASLIVHAVNTYEEREKLLEQAERLIFDMSAVFDLNNLAPSKVKAARDFLAKLEARDA